ncbi:MAG: hypothetical protein JF614_23815 [Acidobacteria bacterium]|nr:hypothetical protein [Acidobacteriota bacterium]
MKRHKMEKLDNELFTPLTTEEARRVGGGNDIDTFVHVKTNVLGIEDSIRVRDDLL